MLNETFKKFDVRHSNASLTEDVTFLASIMLVIFLISNKDFRLVTWDYVTAINIFVIHIIIACVLSLYYGLSRKEDNGFVLYLSWYSIPMLNFIIGIAAIGYWVENIPMDGPILGYLLKIIFATINVFYAIYITVKSYDSMKFYDLLIETSTNIKTIILGVPLVIVVWYYTQNILELHWSQALPVCMSFIFLFNQFILGRKDKIITKQDMIDRKIVWNKKIKNNIEEEYNDKNIFTD